ncbi:hypothetical protein LSH36_1329g00008 [Paralvinella palmiformis]|uniref:Uncharacterized protein n=1 Tax=Paralvinella palmiformis TaxID=53620 RepID=A0AAD9IT72_9ANNE|nr:hypothetical protein LSH36_1329g00008 [Paralvinella palmiformis]
MTFTCACATDGFLDANPCTNWANLEKDGAWMKRSIQCSQNKDAGVCPDPIPSGEIILSPPKLTNWVMLIGYKSCHPYAGRNDFKELKYIGRFI